MLLVKLPFRDPEVLVAPGRADGRGLRIISCFLSGVKVASTGLVSFEPLLSGIDALSSVNSVFAVNFDVDFSLRNDLVKYDVIELFLSEPEAPNSE